MSLCLRRSDEETRQPERPDKGPPRERDLEDLLIQLPRRLDTVFSVRPPSLEESIGETGEDGKEREERLKPPERLLEQKGRVPRVAPNALRDEAASEVGDPPGDGGEEKRGPGLGRGSAGGGGVLPGLIG
jgi:hypothetical protein